MLRLLVFVFLCVGIIAAPGNHDHTSLDHSELCKEIEHKDCSTFETMVVCASDHHTYQNSCEFAKAECKHHSQGLHLHALHYGAC
uniref:Kazal-like domain-containing protein n=1 Tax=Magallana gigas TaxID=29159 RepID=A0A8W8IFN8_MAGGI